MNGFALNNISDCYVGSAPASAIYIGTQRIWPGTPPHDYSQDYFTIKSISNNNTIGWEKDNIGGATTISVSTDNGLNWTNYTATNPGVTIALLNTGDKLLIKGNGNGEANYFTSTGNFVVEGNIMSSVYGDNFIGQTSLEHVGLPRAFFRFCTNLISAENLILPATTLSRNCYEALFAGCTNLLYPPQELPATILNQDCYSATFYGCTSLVAAPNIVINSNNYYACREMFKNCSSLSDARNIIINSMINTATSGGSQFSCVNMFEGCTSLEYAPMLLFTTVTNLTTDCCEEMFKNCTSLSYIKCLCTNPTDYSWRFNWVQNVSSTGTFVKDTNTTWPSGVSGIPTGWTVIDN